MNYVDPNGLFGITVFVSLLVIGGIIGGAAYLTNTDTGNAVIDNLDNMLIDIGGFIHHAFDDTWGWARQTWGSVTDNWLWNLYFSRDVGFGYSVFAISVGLIFLKPIMLILGILRLARELSRVLPS